MAEVFPEHMLRVFGRHTKRVADELLQPLGIRTQEYDTMEIISKWMSNPDVPCLNIATIARRLGVLLPSASDYVGWLQRAGYVRADAGGSRLLTAEGEEFLEECRHVLRPLNNHMADLFKDYSLDGLLKGFSKLQEQEGVVRQW